MLNRDHLARAHEFFEKYGGKAIVLGRFVPIVRTFVPFVAGAGTMTYASFALYNVTGAIIWVGICTLRRLRVRQRADRQGQLHARGARHRRRVVDPDCDRVPETAAGASGTR